jgi:2-polyprenyl-3-methyl-5-hydroxy-6-metoxy-1,4-benzoquinol methylase
MFNKFFDAYGELVDKVETPILVSGRNRMHAEQVQHIINDVQGKLAPQVGDRLLEIGCNIGLLLTPLAAQIESAVGLDHPKLLGMYEQNGVPDNVTLVSGSWPETQVEGSFDMILVYGVLNCLPDAEAGRAFISACYPLLAPGGRLLVGDLPNEEMRARFLESSEGSRVAEEYAEARSADKAADDSDEYVVRDEIFQPAIMDPFIGDAFILEAMADARAQGLNAFVLPQPKTLPFGYSREDLLVIRPA